MGSSLLPEQLVVFCSLHSTILFGQSIVNVAFDGDVTWPPLGGGEDGSTLSVAMFGHRQFKDIISTAEKYINSQSGFIVCPLR